jgi:hypothetical protein
VGVYFSADWCPSCVKFTPILLKYYNARLTYRQPMQIVLVSRCRSSQNTRDFFGPMPWAALPHLESMGTRGQSLMTRFGITTIPALVFLDGNGTVTCLDGRRTEAADPNATAAVPVGDPPAQPPEGPRQVGRSTGDPPTFGCERLTLGQAPHPPSRGPGSPSWDAWTTTPGPCSRPRSLSTTPGEPRARSVSPAAVLAELRVEIDGVIGNAPTEAPTNKPARSRRPSEHVSPPEEPRRRL